MAEASAEKSAQAGQLQLSGDDLNDGITSRLDPMELIHKNALPVRCSVKQAVEGRPGSG